MKKLISYCIFIVMAFSICGCQSREEKALATIRVSMNKTLDDFKSYEPIETKIDSLKYDRYGDTLIVKVIFKMWLMDSLIKTFEGDYKEAKKLFDIWDDPRMYQYSSFAYNKRKKAFENMQIASIGMEATENVRKELLDTLLIIAKKHTDELYGWRVRHKYRCNTTDGTPSIRNSVFFMDKKCENIFFKMNEEEHSWKEYVSYVDKVYSEAKD